jgi:hypothetical protein
LWYVLNAVHRIEIREEWNGKPIVARNVAVAADDAKTNMRALNRFRIVQVPVIPVGAAASPVFVNPEIRDELLSQFTADLAKHFNVRLAGKWMGSRYARREIGADLVPHLF